ncbi:MAG: transcriptional repressor [Clostridiales bacterium]|jgi:Fe2+ or Zn2+ uptake regulation protein|nr:transcriptional repressor [Clostridiales bacterium]
MESQRTAIEDQLRRRGYKLTKQREAIIKVLDSLEENLATAQHIFEKVTETNPGTNFSTVYRNLDLLVQEGILRKTSLGHEASYYELVTNDTHHHHMICKECGKIRCIDYCPIKDIPLQEDGFVPVDHRLEIYGFCKECLGNANILDDERGRDRE